MLQVTIYSLTYRICRLAVWLLIHINSGILIFFSAERRFRKA